MRLPTLPTWFALCLTVLGACGDSAGREPTDLADGGIDSDGGREPLPECDEPLALPFPSRLVEGVPPTEDFTFDGEGYLLALSGGHSLVRMARGAAPELVSPNVVVRGRGMRWLPSGETLIADQDRSLVVAVDAEGKTRRVTTNVANPNGLTIGPGGLAYVTDFGITGEVFRLDPRTGTTTLLASPGKGSNGLTFSPDYRTLYVGDHDLGLIHAIALESDGSAGTPVKLAEGLVRPDGLTTDACGTVYAAGWGNKLYAVSPEGEVQVAASFDGPVSAVSFGSGAQGFDRRKLYVAAISTGGLYELDTNRSAAPAPAP